MTFFSVIIPTYNRSKLLVETINSVLSQNYPHFEVIIVDDGSTDDTGQVIQSTYANDPRIRYYYKQNEERGAARNFGLQHANGDYAIFFDSDDLMKPNYLATLQHIIARFPGIKMLAAKYNYIDNGKIEPHPQLENLSEGWYGQELFLKGNILACHYAIKIKDHFYKLFRPEREFASMEDWLFLLENLAHDKMFIKNEVCVTMRQHDDRSMNNNKKVIEARRKATAWALKNLQLSPAKQKTLLTWSHYFCGVHEYLDNNRKKSIKETIAAMKLSGLNRELILLLGKGLLGRQLIKKIK